MDGPIKKYKMKSVTLVFLFMSILLILAIVSFGCSKQKRGGIDSEPSDWEKAGSLVTSGQYRSVVLADIDNDGNMDVIGGSNLPGTVAIWYGDGRGGFPEYQFLPIKADVRSVSVADINTDDRLDIVFSVQREARGIMVWINDDNRRWIRGTGPDQVKRFENIQTEDVNRDGFEDIIAANSTEFLEGGIQVWLGDGKGNWPVETGPTNEGIYMDVALADFNKDGRLDIAAAGWGTNGALRVWLGDGSGGWSSTAPVEMGSFYGLSTADINGDGNLDVLTGSYRRGVKIFLGNGRGRFQEAPSPTLTGSFWKVLALDMDGDGRLDILAGSIDDEGIKAWANRSAGSWEEIRGRFPSEGFYYDMTTGDINGDGINDLCAASFGEGIKVWMGQGGFPVSARAQTIRQIPSTKSVIGPQYVRENAVFATIDGKPQYKIGPGDVLELTLWQGTKKTREEITVRSDGRISFAFIEDLYVSGLTTPQLDKLLRRDLKAFIKKPRIDVVVKRYNSKFVTLTGAIQTVALGRQSGPGRYALTGKVSLLEMINIAGGPTNDANLNRVRVRRKNGRTFIVDLFKVIIQGDVSQDIILDDGDLVIVPSTVTAKNRVYIYGEVNNPGLYAFTGPNIHILDAISRAGDVTIFAKRSQTKIVRGDISRPEIISVDLKALLEQGDQTQNIALLNGDFVYVPRSILGSANRFLQQIRPLVDLVLEPTRVRDAYGDPDSLQFLKNLP